ncbi:HD domain-containing protein [Staphylococcus aureus]
MIDAWDNKDRPLALCAALLHDLGHGPFSHSFKKYLIQTMKHTHKRLLLEILR